MWNWRTLRDIAVIVWGIGVLLAVLLGIPLALGLQVNLSLIVNALAAAGAFSAAVAAVAVATSDRRDRQRDRERAAAAQAGLVIVEPSGSQYDRLEVRIENWGSRAVLDISVALKIEDHPHLRPPPHTPAWAVIESRGFRLFNFNPPNAPEDPYRLALTGRYHPANQTKDPPTIEETTVLTATVRFRDADGTLWEATFDGPANRKGENTPIGSPRRVSPVTRLG